MSSCPYCDQVNIAGADVCEGCGQSLSDTHLAPPANSVERSLLRDRIRQLHPKHPVITVAPDRPVGEVIRLLVQHGIGCVLVEDQGKAIGVFSERDALRKINVDVGDLGGRPVSEFMTSNPEMLPEGAKIAFAVQRMDVGGFRHVPVVHETGKLAGIISVRDILRYLTEKMSAAAARGK